LIGTVEKSLGILVRVAALLGVTALLLLMGLTVVTVTFRAIGIAFPGTYVLAELLLIPTVSFALAYAAWTGAHTRVELLTQALSPRLAGIVQGATLLCGVAFWAIVTWAGIDEALRRGAQGEATPLLDIPVAPFRWLLVSAMILLIVVLILRATQSFLGRETGE
jgi:TRAP-type C4-dicarboxylate transport system permease small subunit